MRKLFTAPRVVSIKLFNNEFSYLNGELESTTEYGYNNDGQIIKRYTTTIDMFGGENRISYIDSTYDKHGNLTREDILYMPNNESEYNLYIYENDQLIREENYVEDRLNLYKEYTFDNTGLIQTTLTKALQFRYHTLYKSLLYWRRLYECLE